jgi:hypothetical protein
MRRPEKHSPAISTAMTEPIRIHALAYGPSDPDEGPDRRAVTESCEIFIRYAGKERGGALIEH